jgi:Ca2+-binding RTX toxin-like protein
MTGLWVKVDQYATSLEIFDINTRNWDIDPDTGVTSNLRVSHTDNYDDMPASYELNYKNPYTLTTYNIYSVDNKYSFYPLSSIGDQRNIGSAGQSLTSGWQNLSYFLTYWYVNATIVETYIGQTPPDNGEQVEIDLGQKVNTSTITYFDDVQTTTTTEDLGSVYYTDWFWVYVGQAPTLLFTAQADTVNFNNLSPGQVLSVDQGAPLFDALDGNDKVWLPNTTAIPGTTKSWNPATVFQGNAGQDTIHGGKLDDKVDGGVGTDSIDGGRGKDNIEGGRGNDTVSGGAGNDWIKGELGSDNLDGGEPLLPANDKDTVAFDGNPSRYFFIDNVSANTTTVKDLQNPLDVDTISNFESAEFSEKFGTNQLTFSHDNPYVEMAQLSLDAYKSAAQIANARDDMGLLHSGWRPIHAHELRLPISSDLLSTVRWEMANGVYRAEAFDSSFPFPAVAHVYAGNWDNGATPVRTLVIAFRGTDDLGDVSGWIDFITDYYRLFEPLLKAIEKYISEADIQEVLVTGHSLGGILAQRFMGEHPDTTQTKYDAATYGSPGSGLLPQADGRVLHFGHTEDLVANLPQQLAGEQIWIPMNDLNPTTGSFNDGLSINPEHNITYYVDDLKKLWAADPELLTFGPRDSNKKTYEFADNNATHHFGGDASPKESDEHLYGMGGNDTIEGFWGNDTVEGGKDNDKLIGGPSNYLSASTSDDDLLLGGGGDDVLQGGRGTDRMAGGAGGDTFVFTRLSDSLANLFKSDIIQRLDQGLDHIDVARIDANSALIGNQAFSFIDATAFGNSPGQLRYELSGSNTIVSGDTNGDGKADFAVKLIGNYVLTENDFSL